MKNPTQRRLMRYLKSGRIHPSILLTGDDPKVKFETARLMAMFLLCREKDAPCGKCTHCSRTEREIHPDVIFLKEEGEDAIKIERIRELSHQMQIPPLESSRKIAIVDECHRMNAAASNAFLKTLEEPGEGRFFVLLSTQPANLLPTILSRVIQFHFKPEMEAPPLDAALVDTFKQAWQDFTKTGNPSAITHQLGEKEEALEFVKFLETELREAAIGSPSVFASVSRPRLAKTFEAAMEAENRLRSNASHVLIVESLLREHVAGALR